MNIIHLTPYLFQTEQVNELSAALVKFHIEFDKVSLKKDAQNPHLRNSYVSLDNLLNTVRPLLANNGLVISQDLAGDHLTTVIYHISGQFKGACMPFSPMSGNKGTNALQELGGGITYAKRYALSAALGISVDTDDDAQSSKITKEQTQTKSIQKKPIEDDKIGELSKWAVATEGGYQKVILGYDFTDTQLAQFEKLYKLKTQTDIIKR
jgi:hypothetical protein